MPKGIQYYKSSLLTIRRVIDGLLQEMEKENPAPVRSRREIKERIDFNKPGWRKPKTLKIKS